MEAAGVEDRTLAGRLHGMWSAVAPAWERHADFLDARHAHVTARMLDVTRPLPGERVLELACGPGGAGLAAAPLVAPGGEVVLSDVTAEMTAIAAARAAARGLRNVSTLELDLERIDQPDDSYDVVLCRDGLMFAPDPARAAGEIARVLGPGGRIAIVCWGPRERNPWLRIAIDAVSAQLGRPVPPPGVPSPFSLDDAGRLRALLSGAGLADVAIDEIETPLHADSADDWWARTTTLAGPLATILASLPEEAARAIGTRARDAAAAYETAAGGLELPGVALLATGVSPAPADRP